MTTTREAFSQIVAGETTINTATAAGDLHVVGDVSALHAIIDNLDVFMGGFAIVEP